MLSNSLLLSIVSPHSLLSATWTRWDDFNSLSRFSWFESVLWWSLSSVDWDWSNILINEMPYIWSHVLWVSNVLLLMQVLEFWVLNSVNSMLFSWIWGWVHAVVFVDKSMNCFIDSLITNVSLVFLSKWIKPLEAWVLESVSWVCFLCSSPWCWENWLVVGGKSMNFFSNTVVTNVSLVFLD